MKKLLLKNKKIIGLCVVIMLLAIFIPASIFAYNLHEYNKYIQLGDKSLKAEKFNQAIENYNTALTYKSKKQKVVADKVNSVKTLKESKQTYDNALALFNGKKYLEAADEFKNVFKEDIKYYNSAQAKISECKKQYINDNLSKAKAEADNKKYDSAIAILDTILKVDEGNKDALALKDNCNKGIQNIKDAEEATKQTVVKNNSDKTSTKTSSSANSPQPTSVYPKIIYLNNGVHIIENAQQDDGHLGGAIISCNYIGFGAQPDGIYFKLVTGGEASNQPVNYMATFHFSGVDSVYNGAASPDMKLVPIPSNVNIAPGTTVKVDFLVTYKGKTYNFSSTATSY